MSRPTYRTYNQGPHPTSLEREIRAERDRQDAEWGEQNHPDADHRDIDVVLRNEYAFRATRWQEINAERAQHITSAVRCPKDVAPHAHTAWDGILQEKVYEALAEEDPAAVRANLIRLVAAAMAWVEAIDRRKAQPTDTTRSPAGGDTQDTAGQGHVEETATRPQETP